MINITETDPLPLGEFEGGVILKKMKKWVIFKLRKSDGILLKSDVWKDILYQSSYFKSQTDFEDIGGSWREPEILKNT